MGKKTKSKPTSAEKCMALVKDLEVFTDGKNSYAKLEEKGTRDVIARLPSQDFSEYISEKFLETNKEFIKASDIGNIVNHLSYKAKKSGDLRKIFIRFAQSGQTNFIDLGNKENSETIAIHDQGWEIRQKADVTFSIDDHLKPLTRPVKAENAFSALKLFRYVNVKDKMDKIAVLAWLCSLPLEMEHPILMLQGKKESGKTTAAERLRMIYDDATPLKMSVIQNEADMALNFFMNPVCFIDNMDKINPSQANMFCKAVTGDGYSKRALYHDTQMIHFEYERPIVITTLHPPTMREDFLSRCMWIKMQELDSSSLISKNELKKQFASELPSIFGGLLTLTVQAKQEIKLIRLNHSTRTVDFDLFACGVAMALGVDPGKFMRSRLDAMGQLSCYGKNKPFFDSFINLIESSNNKINLSAQELADTLAGELEEDISPIALGKRLADYEDTLDDLNISYSKKRDKSGTQYEIIRKTPEQSDLVVYPKHCHECQHYEYTDDYKQYCHLFADFIDPDPKGVRCTEYTFAEMDWDEDELKIESDIQEVDLPDMNALHGTPKPVEPNELVPQKVTGGYQSVFEDEM